MGALLEQLVVHQIEATALFDSGKLTMFHIEYPVAIYVTSRV